MPTPILVFMANSEQGRNTLKVDLTGASKTPTIFWERLHREQQSKKKGK